MTIRFGQWEKEDIRSYFNKIDSAETQVQLLRLPQESPEWNTVFLLLRKLLAYGIHSGVQTDQNVSYKEFQSRTQKTRDMLVNVHVYLGKFENLLAAYMMHH